ncbi:MAG: lysylphosphatidylglycerol synthetase family protein [Desulfovibrionaceae bacterium]|nr:lysylphosphatidylglycerol synthetase family protein [Desulfovibrionaceae bacterium]
MKKYMRYLGPVLIAAIFSLAVYLLYNKLRQYSLAEIRACIDLIHPARIFLSLAFAVINYCILIGYDWLALKAIHKNLPFSRVSLVSVVGQAVSFNFGALLGGTSVRFRFYSAWGFSIHDVLHLILILAVAFWIGALGLSGLVFIIAPPALPPELLEAMPLHDVRLLGYVLAGIALAYMILCFKVQGPITVFGKVFVFPSPKIAVAQLLVSWIDLVAAAACMWVLLPSAVGVSFIEFLPGFLMAQVAVVLTHVPGGVGVFELVIIHMTNTPHEQMVFAAVLIFRLIYYILPLLVAAMLLAGYEVRQGKFQHAGRWLSVLSPMITSFSTFLGGALLLLSSTLPSRASDIAWVAAMLPDELIPAGHLICAVSGCMLLFVSYGLGQRQRQAFRYALVFLLLGAVGALLKGFSWPAALLALILVLPLLAAHRRFYRKSWFLGEHIAVHWVVAGLIVVACNFALGWALYHTAWGHNAIMSFDGPLNAVRVRLAFIAIGILLPLLCAVRVLRRRRLNAKGVPHPDSGD